jgi:RNA polymerase sigma-70 factor (ECF subfamily)
MVAGGVQFLSSKWKKMTLLGNRLREQQEASTAESGHLSDVELVRRVQRGEAAAFHELVDRYGDLLYKMACTWVKNTADAEDVVQETLAGALKAASSFRGEASVKTWLLRILWNQAARSRRTRWKWRLFPAGPEDEQAESPGPAVADPTAKVDSRIDVMQMLEALSPEHREVLVLRELQGLSYEEIAAVLKVPRGTVESRLHRARRDLLKKYQGYGD